jgi:hypothetical protein
MIVLFPLIAISLRNNLMELYSLMRKSCCPPKAAAADADGNDQPKKKSKVLLVVCTLLAAWCVRACVRECVCPSKSHHACRTGTPRAAATNARVYARVCVRA